MASPLLVAAALAVPLLALLLALPRGSTLVLPSWPRPLWLYLQALLGLAKLARKPAAKGAAKGGSALQAGGVNCRVSPDFRTTPKGDTEVDLVLEAHAPTTAAAGGAAAAAGGGGGGKGGGGGSLVWRATTTLIILSPRRAKQGAAAPAAPASAASGQAPPPFTLLDTWRLGGDAGRRYGLLNADLNPIHLHPLTSRLFGFRRPIAHALYLTGRAEATLRNSGLELRYPLVLSADFKRPTLLPATLHCGWLLPAGAAAAAALESEAGASFAVLSEDRSKEVLVGRISCHPAVVKAAAGGDA
ncbi:hypothetical protein TSOC_007346 [Tetrabaena socialis]|uniref:MaoC-like domain-containing protein n=1 Tax=Tetrabaena socialis TaxID=47790 RepID=A0A2J8A189_9CHLO|nr:hypothetical protein TSOC_007346 [Tetrabaena socialis]|eukprot:PNH06287.1 hypothetical protein TSOC_007346 [Tetrabaena socialis]